MLVIQVQNHNKHHKRTLGWNAPALMPGKRAKPEGQLGKRIAGALTVEKLDVRPPSFAEK